MPGDYLRLLLPDSVCSIMRLLVLRTYLSLFLFFPMSLLFSRSLISSSVSLKKRMARASLKQTDRKVDGRALIHLSSRPITSISLLSIP